MEGWEEPINLSKKSNFTKMTRNNINHEMNMRQNPINAINGAYLIVGVSSLFCKTTNLKELVNKRQ